LCTVKIGTLSAAKQGSQETVENSEAGLKMSVSRELQHFLGLRDEGLGAEVLHYGEVATAH